MSNMEFMGADFNVSGSVMSRTELEEFRRKRGECTTCGRKCFKKKLFKLIPLNDPGYVLEGRCLVCKPLRANEQGSNDVSTAFARPATRADLERFNRSQNQLQNTSTNSLMSGQSSQTSTQQAAVPVAISKSAPPKSRSETTISTNSVSSAPGVSGLSRSSSLKPPASCLSPRPSSSKSIEPGALPQRLKHSVSLPTASLSSYRSTSSGERKPPARNQSAGGERQESGTSLRSSVSSSSGRHQVDDLEGLQLPVHGVLNRGGAYPLHPHSSSSQKRSGSGPWSSDTTISSMSSIEEGAVVERARASRSNRAMEATLQEEEFEGSRQSLGLPGDDMSRGARSRDSRSSRGSRGGDYGHQGAANSHDGNLSSNTGRAGQSVYGDVLIMLREANSPNSTREGLEKLSQMPLEPEEHDDLADLGAALVIVDAMRTYYDSLPVISNGCDAISSTSGTERAQVAFVEAKAVECILEAMEKFINEPELQAKALAALANLGVAPGNISYIEGTSTVSHIVDAMNKYSELPDVQTQGCFAVNNFASHGDPKMNKKLMEAGAGGAVVICMVMHPQEPQLQEVALKAVRNLCSENAQNLVELANMGAIDGVITAMQMHRDEIAVQLEGSLTVASLAENADNRAVIGDCGGIDVVIRAMWVHTDDTAIQECCCRALYVLTADPQNADVVVEIGGLSAIVNAMQAFVDSETIQEMGCGILGNLTGTDEYKMKIVDEEALDAIVLAMVLHADNPAVQEQACVVLLRLAIPQNFKPMAAANIPELAGVAAGKFPSECGTHARSLIARLESA